MKAKAMICFVPKLFEGMDEYQGINGKNGEVQTLSFLQLHPRPGTLGTT